MAWAKVADYVRTVRGLLRGEEVAWGGTVLRLLHPDGFAPPRPLATPILVAASGPKGMAVAAEVGDGVFLAGNPAGADGFAWAAMLAAGTTLAAGEAPDSDRAVDAAGHAAAVNLHAVYEWFPSALPSLPGGTEWRTAIEEVPAQRRHLAVHDLHLVGVTERDRPFITRAAMEGVTWSAAALRERVAGWAAAGVTEVAYQPAGADIPGELERFAAALQP